MRTAPDLKHPHRTTIEIIADIAARKLDWQGELHRDQRLVEDLQLDSIRLLTLAMEVEDHFRIALDQQDEDAITTVGDLVDIVERKRGLDPS